MTRYCGHGQGVNEMAVGRDKLFMEGQGGKIINTLNGLTVLEVAVYELTTTDAARVMQIVIDALEREFSDTPVNNDDKIRDAITFLRDSNLPTLADAVADLAARGVPDA